MPSCFYGDLMNVRAAAANVLFQVVDKGQSLSNFFPLALVYPHYFLLSLESTLFIFI